MKMLAVLTDKENFTKWVTVPYPPQGLYYLVPIKNRNDYDLLTSRTIASPVAMQRYRKVFVLTKVDEEIRVAYYEEE